MAYRNVEVHTCDDCKHVIVVGRGGVHFYGGERVQAKWVGGFADCGPAPKGHLATPYPLPKGLNNSPFEGLEIRSGNQGVALCRKCLAKRFGLVDPEDPPETGPEDQRKNRFDREPV